MSLHFINAMGGVCTKTVNTANGSSLSHFAEDSTNLKCTYASAMQGTNHPRILLRNSYFAQFCSI